MPGHVFTCVVTGIGGKVRRKSFVRCALVFPKFLNLNPFASYTSVRSEACSPPQQCRVVYRRERSIESCVTKHQLHSSNIVMLIASIRSANVRSG